MRPVNKKLFLLLWLFNPFMSSVYLFKNFKASTRIYPYLLLSFFFGMSFVVSTTGADSAFYADALQTYHQQNISLAQVLSSFYQAEEGRLDIYQPLLTWLVSLFTDNVHILFALFALVFGYFWFKSLVLIRSQIQIPLKGLALLTFLFLALTNPIWNVNGVRMWTAVGVFFYGLLVLSLQNNKKGWYFLVMPIFIHFSLISALVVYLIYRILPLKNKTSLFFIGFIFTFFLGELDLEILRSYMEEAPTVVQTKDGYLNEEYAEKVIESKEKFAIHVILARNFAKYCVFIMVLLIYYFSIYKKKLTNKHLNVFFTMGLFFASFTNLASNVPSGVRFAVLSNLIIITCFLFFLNQRIKLNAALRGGLSFLLFYVVLFKTREGLDFIGPFFFIGNPLVNFFIDDVPLIDSIKFFF